MMRADASRKGKALPGTAPAARTNVVLVGDAHHSDSGLVAAYLGAIGVTPRGVADGLAALRAGVEEPISAAVLEVDLPNVSGYQACHALRRSRGPSLPIVLVSATRTEASDRVTGLLMG